MRRPSGFHWAVMLLSMMLLFPSGAFAQSEAPPAPATVPPGGIIHNVVEGDTLWDLSQKYLGDPWKWTEIWELNRFLTNPHYIYPGIRIVIVPKAPTEGSITYEPGVPVLEPSFPEPPPAAAPAVPPAPAVQPPVVREKFLDISPADFVRSGEFLSKAPAASGKILGGREPKVGFSDGDTLYITLDKAVSAGQLLGVYRVRGPVAVRGAQVRSGYVKYLVGVLQVGPVEDGKRTARVRKSFEDITREDLLSEEIPAFARVKVVPGGAEMKTTVLAGRMPNEWMATGDFVFLEGGAGSGMAVGNVFRVMVPTGFARNDVMSDPQGDVQVEVARAVLVRVGQEFSTAYVVESTQPFFSGAKASRGNPAR